MKYNITGWSSIHIDASLVKVWEALIKPEIIKTYFFNLDTHTDWRPGSLIRFSGEWNGTSYHDKGLVLEVEAKKSLKFRYWSSIMEVEDAPENYVFITYNLIGEDGDVSITVTQENIADQQMKERLQQHWNTVLRGLKKVTEAKAMSYAGA
jgi:uncharacterized protein YndB with AHSA1/START domain